LTKLRCSLSISFYLYTVALYDRLKTHQRGRQVRCAGLVSLSDSPRAACLTSRQHPIATRLLNAQAQVIHCALYCLLLTMGAQVIHHLSNRPSCLALTAAIRRLSNHLSSLALTTAVRVIRRPLIIHEVWFFFSLCYVLHPEIALPCHHCVCTICRHRTFCVPLSESDGLPGAVPNQPDGGSSEDNAVRWYVVTARRKIGVFNQWYVACFRRVSTILIYFPRATVAPLVISVSGACFACYPSRAAAEAAFSLALDNHAVRLIE
jgi:hypothetical protein